MFDNDSHIYVSNCYEIVMEELCKLNLVNICCEQHEASLPYLISHYVHIRFHTESKRFRNLNLSKERSQMKTNKKLSKIPKTKTKKCKSILPEQTVNKTVNT